ncbi:MAG: hypothetical protein VKQ33_13010 [Candidatus Sericytochromatia bacterium]|nr:hypothetical protein [Candidatus Sericytochromatia bacterium]
MPEIPGNNSVPGTGVPPGRQPVPPGLTGPGGPAGAGRQAGAAEDAAPRPLPTSKRFFGVHTDASIMARLAAMGVSPTLGNLRIAQQLLRYGQGLEPDLVSQVAQAWAQLGQGDPQRLEAVVALMARGLPITGPNLQAMTQLLAGGPLAHLLARLTMAVKAEGSPKLGPIGQRLNGLWQLGHLDRDLIGQLKDFRRLLGELREEVDRLGPADLSPELGAELGRFRDLAEAHKLLTSQHPGTLYTPFFIWQQQQPLPAELLLQEEGGGSEGVGSFLKLTLAVDTLTLGRVVVEFVAVRETLSLRLDVPDDKTRKRVEPRLVALRQRLGQRGYAVDQLTCRPDGAGRAVSTLLPVRRDLKKLARAQGVL